MFVCFVYLIDVVFMVFLFVVVRFFLIYLDNLHYDGPD